MLHKVEDTKSKTEKAAENKILEKISKLVRQKFNASQKFEQVKK